jgi:hypothetical protein
MTPARHRVTATLCAIKRPACGGLQALPCTVVEFAMAGQYRKFERRRRYGDVRFHIVLVVTIALIGLPVVPLEPALVLPVASGALIVAALAIAALGWLRATEPIDPARITYRDISGALYLLGCGAAVFGEVETVLPLMEGIKLKR